MKVEARVFGPEFSGVTTTPINEFRGETFTSQRLILTFTYS